MLSTFGSEIDLGHEETKPRKNSTCAKFEEPWVRRKLGKSLRGRGNVDEGQKQGSKHKHMPLKFGQGSTFGNDNQERPQNGHAEGHTRGNVRRQRKGIQGEQHTKSNSNAVDPQCRDIHATDDRAVLDHVFRSHDDCRSSGGEAVRAGVGERLTPNWEHAIDGDTRPSEGLSKASEGREEELKHRDHHVKSNRDAYGHEIANHDESQRSRCESEQPEADDNHKAKSPRRLACNYPWTAPRVIAQYLALRMKEDKPTVWSIDDYDGSESWKEENQEPSATYRHDKETSTN